jgi:uncharacterized protein (DUF1778 family)
MPFTPSRGGGRRTRGQERRDDHLTVKMSKTERATISAAARRDKMALAAFVYEAALAAAEYRAVPVSKMDRDLLRELMRLVDLVGPAVADLHQAVAHLNATGEAGPDLARSAAYFTRVLGHVDQAAELIHRRLG